jgi:hypothetical protein
VRASLLFGFFALAGCTNDGVLKGICEGRVPASRPIAITALSTQSPEQIATVDALEVVDREDRPRAFMGVAQGANRGELYVFATDPGDGFLKLKLGGDSRWSYFAFAVETAAKADGQPTCEYTFAADPP